MADLIVNPRARLVPMIGHPIAQVITPEPMNRWFAAQGIEAAIIPMDLRPEGVPDFLRMVRTWENCAGISITMPHKQAAFAAADTLSDRARQAGAVNLMVRRDNGALHGDMTDGVAFVQAIRAKGFEPKGCRFMLIGAGGAGAAVAHAMAENGAAIIHIVDIDVQRRDSLRRSLARHHAGLDVRDNPGDAAAITIVFNATPLGMKPDDALPLDLAHLAPGCFIADAVTKPLVTPFVAAARERGHATLTGEEMALAQLPVQLPLWGFDYTV